MMLFSAFDIYDALNGLISDFIAFYMRINLIIVNHILPFCFIYDVLYKGGRDSE